MYTKVATFQFQQEYCIPYTYFMLIQFIWTLKLEYFWNPVYCWLLNPKRLVIIFEFTFNTFNGSTNKSMSHFSRMIWTFRNAVFRIIIVIHYFIIVIHFLRLYHFGFWALLTNGIWISLRCEKFAVYFIHEMIFCPFNCNDVVSVIFLFLFVKLISSNANSDWKTIQMFKYVFVALNISIVLSYRKRF